MLAQWPTTLFTRICRLLYQVFALCREPFTLNTIAYWKASSNSMNWQCFKVNLLPSVRMRLDSSQVEFDIETNRLVGFVLLCNNDGLPIVDSFLALFLEDIEDCFRSQQIAKFAYVFMAQCICKEVPPFCLGCIETNNCFTATEVLKRWKYIYAECHK